MAGKNTAYEDNLEQQVADLQRRLLEMERGANALAAEAHEAGCERDELRRRLREAESLSAIYKSSKEEWAARSAKHEQESYETRIKLRDTEEVLTLTCAKLDEADHRRVEAEALLKECREIAIGQARNVLKLADERDAARAAVRKLAESLYAERNNITLDASMRLDVVLADPMVQAALGQ